MFTINVNEIILEVLVELKVKKKEVLCFCNVRLEDRRLHKTSM